MIELGNLQHGASIAERAECTFDPAADQVISTCDPAGRLRGGVIYQSFTGASIEMIVAGFTPRWLTRDLLWVFFDYPFIQLGCRVIFGKVREDNERALAFDRKIGFNEVARIDDVYEECGAVILSMRRGDCRWIKMHCPARQIMNSVRTYGPVQIESAEAAGL